MFTIESILNNNVIIKFYDMAGYTLSDRERRRTEKLIKQIFLCVGGITHNLTNQDSLE